MNTPFYHGIIKKVVVAFGNLFSSIQIERRLIDTVKGNKLQTINVPIAFGPKEKYLVRLEQDPSLENNTYTSLPRMSFEITGYRYDSSRKVPKMNRLVCSDDNVTKSSFAPVPYVLDIQLYILTKTQEDALQIIEQILPSFGPEYTVSINAVPDLKIIQDIPITLQGVSAEDSYDGNFDRRTVVHTLSFTAKINLFNAVSNAGVILTSIANLEHPDQTFTAIGDPETKQIVSEEWS